MIRKIKAQLEVEGAFRPSRNVTIQEVQRAERRDFFISLHSVLCTLHSAFCILRLLWHLQRDASAESAEFQQVLVRLSGKRLKRGRPPTPGILLSGLFVLLRIFDFLSHLDFDLNKIHSLKNTFEKLLPGMIKLV